jgi:hypothetical protein
MIAYEQKLDRDLRWAFREGSMHFEKESAVHKSLRQITKRLSDLGIPYAIVGAMAMFFHGYRRFTDDVDILVTRAGLDEIHRQLEGLGYVPPFAGSKHLRDADTGVKIEFITTGDYPGDGKPKPVAFPDPSAASIEIDGMRFLSLPRLVELKLASGMTNPGRLDDLGDVVKMIRVMGLDEQFASQLHSYVQPKYRELWSAVRNNPSEP